MAKIGYTLSSEEHGPNALVDNAVRAESVGFEFVSISDHFHPWTSTQGESPFVWSTLGAIARATDDLEVGVGVTCPTIRMHPAIHAQAVATVAAMFEGRFTFGVGTGENLNEHVLGDRWPEHEVRLEMLEEAMTVMEKLWTGENVSHHGEHYTVENARLYTLPEEPPPVVVSAFGPKTARMAAEHGDGLWTVGSQEKILEAYEEAGGDGPTYTQLDVCYAETEDEAVDTAYEHWPNTALPGELSQQLPTPAHFEQAIEMVDREDIAAGSTVTSPDPEDHRERIREAIDVGYDYVYVHQIGPDQSSFFECYETDVVPAFE
ncbi:TIGR03557 family F420-dependent LLM class oxidoreductase [Natrialbaceae archaeon AArc-T1-2]|uniref:TIGR03557 family F420-dependent LLM class oxidoreductase n=1 Tax=Natrialbaceae archaeon AArc-T1-2 TaxID=3053904 RepID=UPI00255B1319|nr:TIGR03557 family F420-dependent LLM class oxidoreductase [Natrialbaceae archaeon AArc-T1-2]WIV68458.1 TIGR03557 family F420-dependent LLM class oxidoreductase [Natrialbaceae archaeon AArc-T1-2]